MSNDSQATRLLSEREGALSNVESKLSSSAHSVVNTLKVQSDAVTSSLTSLVDQQRQHNLEMLKLARVAPEPTHSDSVKISGFVSHPS